MPTGGIVIPPPSSAFYDTAAAAAAVTISIGTFVSITLCMCHSFSRVCHRIVSQSNELSGIKRRLEELRLIAIVDLHATTQSNSRYLIIKVFFCFLSSQDLHWFLGGRVSCQQSTASVNSESRLRERQLLKNVLLLEFCLI